MAKFEVYRSGKKNIFRFRLKSDNGEIIVCSEGFETKEACLKAVDFLKKNSFQHQSKIDSENSRSKITGNRFHIIKREDGWAIKKQDSHRAYKVYATKKEAIQSARKLRNKGNDIIIHKEDGSVEKWEISKLPTNV